MDTLSSNLEQRPAHMDSTLPPSRSDWLSGPWGPLTVGRGVDTIKAVERSQPSFTDQTRLEAGVTPQRGHRGTDMRHPEVGPWLGTSICTWPVGDLGPEIQPGGLQRLNVRHIMASPPMSEQPGRSFRGLRPPPALLLPPQHPKPVIRLPPLLTPLLLQSLLLGALGVFPGQSRPPGPTPSPPFILSVCPG